MIKMVAFDFDGTIADTIPMCIESFKKVRRGKLLVHIP